MKDENKTKVRLIAELKELRRRLSEYEGAGSGTGRAEDMPVSDEAKFRSLYDAMLEGVGLHELIYDDSREAIDFRPLDVNPRYEEILGLKKEDIINRPASEIFGSGKPPHLDTFVEVARTGKSIRFETYFEPMKKHFSISAFSPGQDLFMVVFEDITERKQAEEALELERAQLISIFDNIDEAVYVTDPHTYEILYVNQALKEAFHKELVGGICYREFQGLDSPCEFCTNEVILKQKPAPYWWEYHNPTLGRDFAILDRIIKWPDGRDVRFELAIDITDRKRAEEALRESEECFSLFMDYFPGVAFMNNSEGSVVYGNQGVCDFLGCAPEEFTGKRIEELTDPELAARIREQDRKVLSEGNPVEIEEIIHTPSGARHWLTHKFPIHRKDGTTLVGGLSMEITDRRRAEEERAKLEKQLRHAQKLETIGTLAGGIAHDFNNILTPIIGYSDMALSSLAPPDPLHEDLKNVLNGAHRAKELVQQILTFSRQMEQEHKPLYLHLIVKEAVQLLRPTIPATIEIRQRIDTACERILADPTQMHQVIVNLCANSFHAMEEKGGVITIELKQVEVDALTAQFRPHLEQKEYVRLSVSDTGRGMDEATMDRIFEPFFTTKTVDKGTGLGLSVVHGIVRSHRGDILVESEPGKGSTFQVYLPIFEATVPDKEPKEIDAIPGGREHILVVDDEKTVATMLRRMLERFGYTVDARHNSVDALKAFRKQPERYDLVITDLTMPNITGLDLAKELHRIRPSVPVIIMTGYGENIGGDILEHYGINEIIGKPIELRKFAAAIRKVMDK
ncbi:MAG: PAS domain S-box protein [Candidatus Krumholzibacteriota bacterium]|nr:PAS domain S-box protein [Candidatus Krumholzibacteriota bacterium]